MSHPQLFIPIRWLSWATPPPLGRVLVLLCYWAVVVYMMSAGAVIKDPYFWERIAFRNAWVTVTQMPLVFLLSAKVNPIGMLMGISHERLNWLHRWVARTMFVTATMHGFHFYTEWVIADFVELEFKVMPMVKYGLGAWSVLLWIVVTSFRPIRSVGYEVFVIQHVISAVMFLWLIYEHIPPIAMYNLWWSIAILCFDRAARWGILAWQNLRVKVDRSRCKGMKRIGHEAQVRAVGKSTTVLTIKDVHFSWKAGQHLYLWLPKIGPVEAHPYTIACAHRVPETCICNSIQLIIRRHSGFSKRLHAAAQKMQAQEKNLKLTAFVTGPYGVPPRWDTYETLVLISASTGASFTLPILESVLQSKTKMCTRRVDFILSARQGEEIDWYIQRLKDAVARSRETGFDLRVHIAITRCEKKGWEESLPEGGSHHSSSSDIESLERRKVSPGRDAEKGEPSTPIRQTESLGDGIAKEYTTRVDIASLIRDPVEAARGETSVIVCSGEGLSSRVRNCVASLSDERAVHKGTGAQGIHLHVETYCF